MRDEWDLNGQRHARYCGCAGNHNQSHYYMIDQNLDDRQQASCGSGWGAHQYLVRGPFGDTEVQADERLRSAHHEKLGVTLCA